MVAPAQLRFDLPSYLQERKAEVEAALDAAMGDEPSAQLREAMRYSLMAGGKRLRPVLCLASCELAGGDAQRAMATACALEMVHTMSLIHDDLPAMDDDDLRRGRPTNHKVFGEATAILAGDGLLCRAFEMVAARSPGVPAERLLAIVARLATAAGAPGLVGGQMLDLDSEGKRVPLARLEEIHLRKTAALLEVSVTSGALVAGAEPALLEALGRYARNIGLAFQIIDDILDVTADSDTLGKTAGKDERAEKSTYPALLGLEASRERAGALVAEAKDALGEQSEQALPLLSLADFIINRNS